MPVRSGSVSAAFHRRSSKGNMIENTFGHYNTLSTRRNNYSDDLMMTSDVSDDVINMSATIDRTIWNHSRNNGATADPDDSIDDATNGSNRWSWLSNSSHCQSFSNEKVGTVCTAYSVSRLNGGTYVMQGCALCRPTFLINI